MGTASINRPIVIIFDRGGEISQMLSNLVVVINTAALINLNLARRVLDNVDACHVSSGCTHD